MQDTIEAAKAEFLRAKDRMAKALATTPDDRIHWSPSETARTPIDQVAHAAMATAGMQDWFSGKPFPFKDVVELDTFSRTKEKEFTSREQALAILDQTSNDYLAWLDALTPEQVSSTLETAMGTFPMASAITFPADHIRAHASQMEYTQTIYGDLDWHMG